MRDVVAIVVLVLASIVAIRLPAAAHEIRPAYLEVVEVDDNRYEATWRTPLLSGAKLPVAVVFPEGSKDVSPPVTLERSEARTEHRRIEVPGGLAGKRLRFVGLEATITDALVRLSFLDGRQVTQVVHPSRPYLDVAPSRGWGEMLGVYVLQGVEHILQGVDHLLFLFGLMLLVRDRWMLVKTITAFTVAHSLTLAASAFGLIHVPSGPLNAAIALSILFLGVEVMKSRRGETSLAIRRPWVVAFAFGLLHGVGFASGLSLLGLPSSAIPAALLSFNVGVEAGQLVFVAAILLLVAAFGQLRMRLPPLIADAPAYLVGSLGAYWTIGRVAMMGTGG